MTKQQQHALWPNGVPCAGQGRCQSNDHVNRGPLRDDYRPEIVHAEGGYALRQEWL